MSLKSIHVIFIVASIALAHFMGVWGVVTYMSPAGSAGHLLTGIIAFLVGAGLIVYAIAFVKKTRLAGIE
jgi:heme A synthase